MKKITKKIKNLFNFKKKGNNTTKTPKVKTKAQRKKTWKIVLLIFLVCCIIGLTSIGLFLGYIVKHAPTFDPSSLYDTEPTILYDRDGNEFARLGEKIRSIVTYDQLPQTLIDAIVATEDSRFFQHAGFDVPRFLKASVQQAIGKSDAGGASTLTMQISKNKLTQKGNDHESKLGGIIRKFTDIYMAVFKIEKTYTKEEILEFYVNSNYMGAGTNGVEDASQVYFGKSVSDLTISEAAMLTGIFNAPDYYDPYKNPARCEQRRQTVLYLLKRHGYINDDEYKIALEMTVDKILKPKDETKDEQYASFILTVVEDVINKTGSNPYDVPMKIYTTMDREKQEHMDRFLAGETEYKWKDDKAQAASAVISVEDGSLVAVAAGRNRSARGYNLATDSRRQIGSTAKPLYDYSIGIEKLNWSTGQIFVDEPWHYSDGGEIENWQGKHFGFMTMRQCLVESMNIPALKAFQQIDSKTRKEWIDSLGLHPEVEDGIIHEAHATGGYNGESPLSLAAAYTAFASGGYYTEPYTFTKIEYNDGSEPYEYKPVVNRVMSEETAWMITNMLVSVYKGTGFLYVNGVNYAAKSGTTNLTAADKKAHNITVARPASDLWAVGYTDKYTIAIWKGYESLGDGYEVFGSQENYKVFAAIAKGVFKEQANFKQPEGVVAVETEVGCYEACLPSQFTPSNMRMTEYYKKGYEPTTVSDRYAKLANVDNLKASVNGSKVELSWDAITTPHAIDKDYLDAYFANAYENEDWGKNAALERYNENISNLGTIVYKVYQQVGDKLVLVTTTDKTKATVSAASSNPTFVVKTSYTVFTSNMSDGVSIKVSNAVVTNIAIATQNLKNVEVAKTDTKIKDENKIATVSVNGIAVDSSKVTYTYKLDNTKNVGDEYKINVKVIYNNATVDTFEVTVKVKS